MRSSPSQLKTIVTLFVVLRVTILLLYTPQGLLNAYTDYQHYYRVAQLSDQGYYPYVNLWYEHLPIMAYTSQAVYAVTRALVPIGGLDSFSYQFFARLLGSVMLLFETGALIALHRIARRMWDDQRADWIGWVYATLSVPIFFWNASQTSGVLFFTLLAIDLWLNDRRTRSVIALSLGILTKFTPVFLFGVIARALSTQPRALLRFGLVALIVAAVIFAPFVALGGTPWIAASLASNLGRVSWATPWAVIDGNWGVGDVGELLARTQLDRATQLTGNPPVIPSVIVLALFAAIYLWLFRRPIDLTRPASFVWFATLLMMLFHLWSKGWSPQWATLILPFMLLSFPNQRGLTLTLILTGLVFVEWPLADALHSRALLMIAIAGRTLLFGVIAVHCARALWPQTKTSEAVSASEV
ncbi:MAG: hypothetical protein U0559_18760 [Anaerolineae bacterium]